MKAQYRNAALVAAFCCIASIAFAEPPKTPRISLAGTFNNWNTSDPDYTLKPVGDKFELVRAWPCGTSDFKFVFDGSWAKHLGDAGGGKLTQPGGDIKLIIPQSGTYALGIDLSAHKWDLSRRRPSRPVAAFVVKRDLNDGIVLDGRISERGSGNAPLEYRWEFIEGTDARPHPHLSRGFDKFPIYNVLHKPSVPFRVQLVVDDMSKSDPVSVSFEPNAQWCLRWTPVFDPMSSHDGDAHKPLIGRGDGTWYTVIDRIKTQKPLSLVLPNASDEITQSVPLDLDPASIDDQPLLIKLNERTLSATATANGFHIFRCSDIRSRLSNIDVIEQVDIIGDFNGWRIGATRMRIANSYSVAETPHDNYVAIVELPDGVHHYKFVINGAIHVNDPNADPKLADADGNSGVRIGLDPEKLGPVKPNDVILDGLFHDPSNNAWFAPIASDAATVTIRALADDAQAVAMHIEGVAVDAPLRRVERRDGFDYWRGQVVAGPGSWTYSFAITDGTATVRLAAKANADKGATTKPAFQGNLDMHFKTPDWAKSVVWYQIFPERFRNGDTSNDPPGTVPWKHSWFKPYKGPSTGGGTIHEKGGFFNYIYDRRYGGDLQGVRDKLPYLRELGVTAIYFNPIFLAESLHKYDASDYRHIDDFFGVKDSLKKIKGETDDPKTWQWSETDKLFLDFLQEAHRQGFKVVLDGVFNHVGRDFWAFRDVIKNGEKSPYAGWFDIMSFKPFHYKAWDKDDGSLPRLKHDEALGLATPVREHLFAVTRRWMDPNGDGNPSDGIDGWRLDVAADINVNFWRDWRALVKKTNPDAYIVAELWQESRAWLDGQSFDAVMNYPFAVRSQRFFVNNKKASKPSQFLKEIHEILGWYAPHVNHCLQNLYDSHDTDRLASMFLNPDLEYDQTNRPQDNGPNYNTGRPTAENYHRIKLAVTWQMMFLGSPMIYYGNEVGMFGADDPTDRKPMLWPDLLPYNDPDERIEADVFEHHQRMIAIRNTNRALRLGSFESVYDDDRRGIVAFVRRLGGEAVLVVINNSDKNRRVRLPTPWDGKGKVYRVDDPSVAEIKPAAGPQDRATIAIKPDAKSPQVIEKGVLKGITLAPRTAGVYVLVEKE